MPTLVDLTSMDIISFEAVLKLFVQIFKIGERFMEKGVLSAPLPQKGPVSHSVTIYSKNDLCNTPK